MSIFAQNLHRRRTAALPNALTHDTTESDPGPDYSLDVTPPQADTNTQSRDGYSEPHDTPVSHLTPGDLIEYEDRWVTVDDEIQEDPDDETRVLLSWRDDTDTAGIESVEDDAIFTACTPITD